MAAKKYVVTSVGPSKDGTKIVTRALPIISLKDSSFISRKQEDAVFLDGTFHVGDVIGIEHSVSTITVSK